MSQFGSGMADQIVTDGDRSFTGINQRRQINELAPGEVRESLNGRMDGYWKPRKSVVSRSIGLATGAHALAEPFFLIDSNKSLSSATWSGSTITLTTASAHGLTGSAFATLGNTTAGQTAPLSGSIASNTPIAGSYLMTVTSATTLTFDYPTAIGSGTFTLNAPTAYLNTQLNDGAVSDVFGSCIFSDPNSTAREFILVATNTSVRKIMLDAPYTMTTIALPSDVTIDAECHMLQAFDKVIIFRKGKQALQWNGQDSDRFYKMASGPYDQPHQFTANTTFTAGVATVTGADADLSTMTGTVVGGSSATPGTVILPAYFDDGTAASDVTGFYVGATIKIQTTSLTTVVDGNVSAYDGPTRKVTLSAGTTETGTSYLMSKLQTSGAVPGFVIKVVENPSGTNTISANDVFVIATTPKYNQFTYQSSEKNTATGTSIAIKYSYSESIGGGFSYMPAAPWGTYFQRRLWVPYWYEVGGTTLLPTYTDRGIRDEIMASDILDSDTYDQIMNQFRITGGIADYTMAMQPFYEDSLMVLNRNSLHIVAGTQGALNDTVVKELTSEIGCLARKSVIIQGPNVFFLSDSGVYGLTFVEQYNLRGIDMPISVTIQPYIDRISKNLASNAVGIYFNNRYWLAVPLDSKVGAQDARGNNTVLIYNFLNKGWESIDTYGDVRFNILNFHIGKAGERNALYIITTTGGLHEVDVNEASNDLISVDNSTNTLSPQITSRLISRGYDFGTVDRKRFTDAQIQIQSLDIDSDCSINISFSSQDPDESESINTTSVLIGETLGMGNTANVRTRLAGIRGYTGTVVLDRLYGSPKVNSIAVSGTPTNRQIITQH